MKQFIMFSCLMILLLVFPIQIVIDRETNSKIENLERIVFEEGVQRARKDGYFTPDNITNLKSKISSLCGVDESRIVLSLTTTPKYKTLDYDENELIHYSVGIPIDEIVAAPKLWGIDPAQNNKMHTISGVIASELLP